MPVHIAPEALAWSCVLSAALASAHEASLAQEPSAVQAWLAGTPLAAAAAAVPLALAQGAHSWG